MADVVDLLFAAEGIEFGGDAHQRLGVPEAGGSHFHGRSPGDEELGGVLSSGDAAKSDDGDFDGTGGFVDQSQGDWFDGRAG